MKNFKILLGGILMSTVLASGAIQAQTIMIIGKSNSSNTTGSTSTIRPDRTYESTDDRERARRENGYYYNGYNNYGYGNYYNNGGGHWNNGNHIINNQPKSRRDFRALPGS